MEIRKTEEKDFSYIKSSMQKLFEMHRKLDEIYGIPSEDKVLQSLWDSNLGFVACDERNKPVGFIRGRFFEKGTDKSKPFAILHDIYVEEQFREKGTGKELLNAFVESARDAGAHFIELQVDIRNKIAKSFWENNGFGTYQAKMYKKIT